MKQMAPPQMKQSVDLADQALNGLKLTQNGNTFEASISIEGTSGSAAVPTMVATMLPAVMQARSAARRSLGRNNLKQIGLAMHNYHDVNRKLPDAASVDQSGKPLLSWRVHVLPYVDQKGLFDKFHLNEPWDSPHNKALADSMPAVFQDVTGKADKGKTRYQVILGPGSTFEGGKGKTIRGITDGTSNTIIVVEVSPAKAVEWTKPADITYSPSNPLDGLVAPGTQGFNALRGDGSVTFISNTIDPKNLAAMFTASGGEPVK